MTASPPGPSPRRAPPRLLLAASAAAAAAAAASASPPALPSSFVVPPPRRRAPPPATTTGTASSAPASRFFGRGGGRRTRSPTRTSTTELFLAKPSAKKKKKKKGGGGGGGGGGGFGAPPPPAAKKAPPLDQDYSVFPALEDSVRETLVPVVVPGGSSSDGGAEMTGEMYDRLAQIYGFGRFNYEEGEEAEAAEEGGGTSVSFDELIGSSSSTSAAPSPSSSLDLGDLLGAGGSGASKPAFGMGSSSGDDLSDLISSATGGTSPAPASGAASAVKLNLSALPPFSGVRVLHVDPCVLAVDGFFTPEECDAYVALSSSVGNGGAGGGEEGGGGGGGGESTLETRSKTVGKDSRAKAQRTSTTWFHKFRAVPELMAKASRLLGLDGIDRWEEPQTVRYRKTEKFTWHLDALAPSDDLAARGGQRVATLLVYLTDLSEEDGGATVFRDLTGPDGRAPLKMRPKKGTALLFFPAAGGIPGAPFDVRTLHAGEAVSSAADGGTGDKWIAQLWLRENGRYEPSAPPGNRREEAADAINAYCAAAAAA